MSLNRRDFINLGGAAAVSSRLIIPAAAQQSPPPHEAADHTIRIRNGLVELAPDRIVSTTTNDGQFPGPLLRRKEGRRVTVDTHNDTDTPEQLHWHDCSRRSMSTEAAEEGTPFIPAHGMRRIASAPKPAVFRFYHSHVVSMGDLSKGTYSGQAAPL